MVVPWRYPAHVWITFVKPKREKRLRVPNRNHGVEFLAHSWFILDCRGRPFRGYLEIKLIAVLCIWFGALTFIHIPIFVMFLWLNGHMRNCIMLELLTYCGQDVTMDNN